MHSTVGPAPASRTWGTRACIAAHASSRGLTDRVRIGGSALVVGALGRRREERHRLLHLVGRNSLGRVLVGSDAFPFLDDGKLRGILRAAQQPAGVATR